MKTDGVLENWYISEANKTISGTILESEEFPNGRWRIFFGLKTEPPYFKSRIVLVQHGGVDAITRYYRLGEKLLEKD